MYLIAIVFVAESITQSILDNLHFRFTTYDRLNDFQSGKHVELDSLCKTYLEGFVVALYQ
jgi:hypothetical protein